MSRNKKQSNRGEEVNKLRLPDAADPRDGVRLIRAFLEIKEPAWRDKLILFAEDLAKVSSDDLGTADIEENRKRAFRDLDALVNSEDDPPAPAEIP